ncbi:hypothetical protein K450DRAFT_194901 [Umbelopsis ramanniana AG]|uniref:Thioesterase domain-containing protein n=1 Tax=Umbelopsis ramanniana AG TaxID=1314678 RepID=A0AAD5EJS0_UMBRA|nr:uncharacterized protein K450DRAFT_194901 [Umbelopsis ramanniana AG]KAI8584450.1 hypothetical protein K450DRAFT_194901 [Umbelopsis ramanniana AG]
MSPLTGSKVAPFVQRVLKNFHDAGGFDAHCLSGLKIVSADSGSVQAQFQVEKHHLNRLKSVHGGLLSTVVDIGGSLALASKGLFATGVSTDLNVTFVSSAKLGQTMNVDAKCVKLGRTLAFTEINVSADGKIVCQGRHTKFVTLAYDHPDNILKPKGTQ